jgi:hypothetical protein
LTRSGREAGRLPRLASRSSTFKLLRILVCASAAWSLSTLIPAAMVSPFKLHPLFTRFGAPPPATDPAYGWKDDVWPLREQTPWDISTDFPFPRKLEYDVTEGTWLRLDVNPKTGDIVFDMLGDLYCLPAGSYDAASLEAGAKNRAVPVLVGVPHDSDPHFSPQGDKLVFRSDAELGTENIWVMEWKGCAKMDVRPVQGGEEDLLRALSMKDEEDDMLARGVPETADRKRARLLREGRLDGTSQTATTRPFH